MEAQLSVHKTVLEQNTNWYVDARFMRLAADEMLANHQNGFDGKHPTDYIEVQSTALAWPWNVYSQNRFLYRITVSKVEHVEKKK